MRFNRFVFVVSLGAVSLLASSVQPGLAAPKSLVAKMSGVWVGSGSIYQSSSAPRERVRCRFSAKEKNRSTAISLRYICLGIDIKFETTGTLKINQASKTIAGKLVTVGIGAFKARGQQKGNKITLNLTGKNKKTGKPVSGTLLISFKGNSSFQSAITATDPKNGKRFQAFKARFKR